MKDANYDEVLGLFRARINVDCNQADLAREFGVTRGFVSQVINQTGGSLMNGDMLKSVGYERVVAYRKVGK